MKMKKLCKIFILFILFNTKSFAQIINLECKSSSFDYFVVIDLENNKFDASNDRSGYPDKLRMSITEVNEKFIYAESDIQILSYSDGAKLERQALYKIDRRIGTIIEEAKILVDTRDKSSDDLSKKYGIQFFDIGIGTSRLYECKKTSNDIKF